MLTAKKFKDLGVNFIDGDKLSDTYGISYTYKGSSLWKGWLTYKMDFFAWRPISTLPYNPRFKYEQDFSQAEIKWRPLLDQSDVKAGEPTKPVFTQAMADAGELPPVGSECKFLWTNLTECSGSNQDRTLKVIAYNEDNTIVWGKMNGNKESNLYRLDSLTLKPLDTRTPKQKAVDDLKTDILNFYGYNDGDGYKSLSEYLNEIGYRKID